MKNYKNFIGLLFFALFQVQSYSQVGIGTTNPEPSSILDIESTTQGILTPRMTTVQRNAIASPAEGLTVYDTDESAFYYFDSLSWVELEGAETRDNYKLVKSAADLADELAAGGGSVYELDENFMYEINGTITLGFPIDLNGAYIRGQDTGEDILVNASGGALFIGSSGRMKDLLINGGSSPIFDITGSGPGGTDSIIAYSIVITSASAVGTLSELGTVFFEVLQVVNSNNGLVLSNINTFFMDKVFWTESNSGTFLDLSGAFDNFQIANGRVVADSGETGIDVSANPAIGISASLTGLNISGNGTRVSGYVAPAIIYSGYNFTNDWDVDCPGIPKETDGVATGNFYYTGSLTTGFSQSILNGDPIEVQGSEATPPFAANSLFRFSSEGGGNRLRYQGLKAREFQINASLSVRVTGAATNFYAFVIAKNGVLVTESNSIVYIDSDSQIQNVSINADVNLSNGDYIEVYTERLTGSMTDALVVFSENLSIK
ncbi:cell wall anchor protein [Algibacter sp. Ld11]|uniref:cell wall anchor protein n=1 Tax=Algibacter sp. Ld11 TaxID=649150 RepID=UPI003870E915